MDNGQDTHELEAAVARLQAVRTRIVRASGEAGRDPATVQLLAVSKTFGPAAVRALAAAGQGAFGENYVQEALEKQRALADLPLVWHFIGPIQSNKTRPIVENFAWAHSVDRLKVAERLSAQRPPGLPRLHVCLEVNVSGEASKGGVAPAELPALADAVARLPALRLRGLMAIPAPAADAAAQRAAFRRVRELFDALKARGHDLDTLSMGMSADLEAAILEGATIVRVGTALFGERNYGNA
jgi:pyridoxal phosphate enzyme (YggS family)